MRRSVADRPAVSLPPAPPLGPLPAPTAGHGVKPGSAPIATHSGPIVPGRSGPQPSPGVPVGMPSARRGPDTTGPSPFRAPPSRVPSRSHPHCPSHPGPLRGADRQPALPRPIPAMRRGFHRRPKPGHNRPVAIPAFRQGPTSLAGRIRGIRAVPTGGRARAAGPPALRRGFRRRPEAGAQPARRHFGAPPSSVPCRSDPHCPSHMALRGGDRRTARPGGRLDLRRDQRGSREPKLRQGRRLSAPGIRRGARRRP